MKHLKRFEDTSYSHNSLAYQSLTFSEHDGNILDLFTNIKILKKEKIEYEIYKHDNPVIYFKIFAFPRNLKQYYFLNNNTYKFSRYHYIKKIKDIKKHLEEIGEKLNKNITKEDIDVIYKMQKYNL